MLTQAVLSPENKELKKVELSKAIFGAPVRQQLLFDCVQIYLANKRQGTVKAKFRCEVRGSTKKIYRQKGTGNARHGGIRANIFVGGGVSFPPRPRDWHTTIPQKARQEALISALSLRKKEGNLIVISDFPCEEIKTQKIAKTLKKWGLAKCLVVIDQPDPKLWKSIRNIPNSELTTSTNLNVLDIVRFEKIVVTEKALQALEKRLS
ncbi:MAG: 50S ribosomal protein L4 [Deltaproteobacteria bacterium RIFCSPLOWO2_02_FULL_46_8]|nr:MAG: 50S ribosomal protein L4 [Deltaproteobacteria bacterium RIFCSPLOWO2_02_FULL_46_8]